MPPTTTPPTRRGPTQHPQNDKQHSNATGAAARPWTSKKNGHRATSIAHPVLLKMQRAATQRQHEDDVQMSTMRRPKLAVGVLDAPPLSASMSEKDPVLLRHRGRHLSACCVDGVWVRLALAQHYGSTIGEISSSTMHGLTPTCDPVASGRVKTGVARCAGEGGGRGGGCSAGQSMRGVRNSPKPSSQG